MVSILPPTILGAIFIRRLPKPLVFLTSFAIITAFLEVLTYVLYLSSTNNIFLVHIHSFIEFAFISLIYYVLLKTKFWRALIWLFSALFVAFSIVNFMLMEDSTDFNSNQRYVEGIILFVYFIAYIGKMINDKSYGYIENHPYFILTINFMLYFGGTLFLFLFGKQLLSESNNYWVLHGVLNITLNLINTIVIWRGYKIAKFL